MQDIDKKVEEFYKELQKIEVKQKKKNCVEADDFTFHAVDRCMRGRYAR